MERGGTIWGQGEEMESEGRRWGAREGYMEQGKGDGEQGLGEMADVEYEVWGHELWEVGERWGEMVMEIKKNM